MKDSILKTLKGENDLKGLELQKFKEVSTFKQVCILINIFLTNYKSFNNITGENNLDSNEKLYKSLTSKNN